MEQTSSVIAESNPQPEARAPQSPSPQSPSQPDSEARYQRRSAFLNNPRTKWGLILAGLVILTGIFFLWRYLASYESPDPPPIAAHVTSFTARPTTHLL